MYRLESNGKLVGVFEKVIFTKKSESSGCFVECEKGEADGLVAGGNIYALTNAEDYQDYDQVSVAEVDGEIARSAELDYIRVMSNLI